MENDNTSFTNEYRDFLDFLRQMQETAREQSYSILSEKKELEYKKRQQEYLLEEQEKQKIPNISMFSPLSTDDTLNMVANKDELQRIVFELNSLEEKWQKQNEICSTFGKLKKFLSDVEGKMHQADKAIKETETNSNKVIKVTNTDNNVKVNTNKNFRPVVSPESDVTYTATISNDSSTNYSAKLLKTQEMDRNRISRDLHDSTVQSLTSFGHKLEFCSRMVDKDPVRVKLELQTLIDMNKEIINGMREIIYDLRPMSLNNIGFVSSVEAYCQHLRRNDNFDVVLKVNGQEQKLSSITSVTLFRILQEACNNSLKHSKAKKVYIRISFTDDTIELDVDDDGVGFNVDLIENREDEDFLHGFGLSTMRERAKLLSGTFTIKSRPGFGTKIHVSVPLSEADGEEYYV